MIPKRMVFFWAGSPLSWMRYMTVKSFCHFNPKWEVFIYTTEDCETEDVWGTHECRDFDTYKGRDYWKELLLLPVTLRTWNPEFDISKMSPVHQSDIFTYWFLLNEGGFYSDFDILYTSPIPNEWLTKGELVFCLVRLSMAIGFLGAKKGNKFYRDLLEVALKNTVNAGYQSAGVDSVYKLLCKGGKVPRKKSIEQINKLYGNVYEIPQLALYPWIPDTIYDLFIEERNAPIMNVGIHWYGGTKLAQQANKITNEETVDIYKNTFTKYARKIP